MAIHVSNETMTELEPISNWALVLGEPAEAEQGVGVYIIGQTMPTNALAQHYTYISRVAHFDAFVGISGNLVTLYTIDSFAQRNIGHLACRMIGADLFGGISLLFPEDQAAGGVLELGRGYEVLMLFDQRARNIVAAQGIRLISARIREWVSAEDPDWQETVVDYEVEANPQVALALWDRLSDELQKFQDSWPGGLAAEDRPLLSVTVRWK